MYGFSPFNMAVSVMLYTAAVSYTHLNSEILLHDSLWFFYAYLWGLYDKYGCMSLKKNYDILLGKVQNFLTKQGYLNLWISEDLSLIHI